MTGLGQGNYPTKEGGQEWYLSPDNPLDGMFVISPTATPLHRTPDGSWLISRETAGPEDGLRMCMSHLPWRGGIYRDNQICEAEVVFI